MKKLNINNIDLYTIPMDKLVKAIQPWALNVLLENEPLHQKVDILLDNMMYYFLENENYEYCVVIKNEIERRKLS